MERVKLTQSRVPLPPRLQVEWPGVFENYARGYVYKNFWRVKSLFLTEEDALQEAALIWVRCYKHYCYTVDNPAWFMSLYKMSLANDWHTFATRDSRRRDTQAEIVREASRQPAGEPIELSQGPLAAALMGASAELRIVLATIARAPAEALDMLFGSDNPTLLNRRLKRFCGIKSPSHDVVAEIKNILS